MKHVTGQMNRAISLAFVQAALTDGVQMNLQITLMSLNGARIVAHKGKQFTVQFSLLLSAISVLQKLSLGVKAVLFAREMSAIVEASLDDAQKWAKAPRSEEYIQSVRNDLNFVRCRL